MIYSFIITEQSERAGIRGWVRKRERMGGGEREREGGERERQKGREREKLVRERFTHTHNITRSDAKSMVRF